MVFDLAYDYEACFARDPTLKKSDIDELMTWVQSLDFNSTVPKDITNKQLLVFHVACEQVIEYTKKCIKSHYNLRDKGPDQFDNRDGSTKDMVQTAEAMEFIYLPEKTKEGYGILMHRLHDFNVDRYNYVSACKLFCMTLDAHIYENGPDKGIIVLVDMRGVKLGHLSKINIGVMAKYLAYVQEGLNVRIVSIEILNVVSFFDKIMKLLRPFLRGELIKRMVLHSPDMNWEEFYKDVLPKRCLPSDFGGDLPDTQTLNRLNIEKVQRFKPYFTAEEKQRHFYSKDNKKKSKNIESSFTHLDID